ncbi:alkaline phosphatase family protein [Fontimonas sp. SYSU GA230001]|uniref:alkaline phosphatase family protein n=1 Tax=Fontimonas sp. SYSU GA230001 TaxID=3142450 RepID=UPI0032B491D7
MRGVSAMVLATAMLAACGSGNRSDGNGGAQPTPTPPALGSKTLTVVVAVVDSLMPSDIGPQTPTLQSLIDQGTMYAESRSVFSAETIPNHVAMMTGVVPERSGIPTNNFLDFDVGGAERDLSVPEKLTAKTLFTWITEKCGVNGAPTHLRHGATLSKKYLYEIFQGDAADPQRQNDDPAVFNVPPESYWDPRSSPLYIGPGSEHTPDIPTMQQALTQLPDLDFHFINLGDVDRSSHAGGQVARLLVLADTDLMLSRLVSQLQSSGRWENTVLIVLSDHGMDYTLPGPIQAVSVQPLLDQMAACHAPMQAVQNGGTDSLYIQDRSTPPAERQAALRAVRACLLGTADCGALCPGASRPFNAGNIAYAWYTQDDPTDPDGNMPASVRSKHPNLGDLVLVASGGLKFSEPDESGNPIPGNHGQLATIHNFMLVTGGSPWVKKGQLIAPSVPSPGPFDRLPEQSETIDVAPTVAWLLGLGIRAQDFPDGAGFDGRVLKEAFVQFDGSANPPAPTVCGRFD